LQFVLQRLQPQADGLSLSSDDLTENTEARSEKNGLFLWLYW
jgi:hypothetical protein